MLASNLPRRRDLRGRLSVGLASAWSRDEYDAVGKPWERRGERSNEFIDCLEAVWTQDEVKFRAPSTSCRPRESSPSRSEAAASLLVGGTRGRLPACGPARDATRAAHGARKAGFTPSPAFSMHAEQSHAITAASASSRGIVQGSPRPGTQPVVFCGSVQDLRLTFADMRTPRHRGFSIPFQSTRAPSTTLLRRWKRSPPKGPHDHREELERLGLVVPDLEQF